jgi:eukaryotic-like serine/threonine-protein kinase
MTLQVHDTIDGKYRIVRLLGEGGMGAVYEGENTRIHRRVAIKVLHSGVAQSKDAVERFEREAQAAGRIGSEHIVEVLDLGNLPNGERFMVMEFLDGESLADRIAQRGRLEARAAADLAVQLLEGLRAAHDAGIVHRDLKPDNVFLLRARSGRKDFVKIVDFGISKFSAMSGDFSMTRTGAVMGTPYYMAPEQAKGERSVNHRADLYAVGVILYEAATGKVPFDADTFNELLFKIVLEEPVSVRDKVPEVDPEFAGIVQRAMAKNPEARFQSAAEFQAELVRYLESTRALATGTAASLAQGSLDRVAAEPRDAARPVFTPDPQRPSEDAKKAVNTQGSWANTQDGAIVPEALPKTGSTKLVLAAVGSVIALAAALMFALGGQKAESNPAAQPEGSALAPSASPSASPVGQPGPKDASPTAETPPSAAEVLSAEAKADREAAPVPVPAPATKEASPPLPKPVHSPTTATRTTTGRPASKSPATSDTAGSTKDKSSGRRIRTTL